MSQETAKNLGKLIATFNDKRVVSDGEMQEVLTAIVAILAENKKGVDSLSQDTKKQLEEAVAFITDKHGKQLRAIQDDLKLSKTEIEKATKEQNDRAFKRLQTLLASVKIPKDGKDGVSGKDGLDGKPGKDGSPDQPQEIRNKLETLKDNERLDASAIKNLPEFIKKKGKEMLVGGIRFLENLADVSIPPAKKRQDLLIHYDTTDSRWEDHVALTVGSTPPTNPEVNDLWVDTN